MITVSMGDVVSFLPSLRTLMGQKLPAQAAYRLSRIADKLQSEIKTYEDARNKLFKELGTPKTDLPGVYEVSDPQKRAELEERHASLLSEEIKVDIAPLPVDMLGDAEVAGADLYALRKVII